jgi:hypothetical protein
MKTRLFITMAAFVALTIAASAQTTGNTAAPAGPGKGQGAAWVDKNNNGVCDNYENGTRMGRGQAAGKGQAMHHGRGKGAGRGQGMAQGKGSRRGQGPNFIDENKNDICDNRETPAKK